MTQFPSPAVAHVGKFVAFIAGSFAALLLALALVEDTLLERHLFGRTLVRPLHSAVASAGTGCHKEILQHDMLLQALSILGWQVLGHVSCC